MTDRSVWTRFRPAALTAVLLLPLAAPAYVGTATRWTADSYCYANIAQLWTLWKVLRHWHTQWTGRFGFNLLKMVAVPPAPSPDDASVARMIPLDAQLGNVARVEGYSLAGDPAQYDGQPLGGAYPTTGWVYGSLFAETYTHTTPEDLAAGARPAVVVGLYDLETLKREAATGEDGDGNLNWVVLE
jgi:hypothetical protein